MYKDIRYNVARHFIETKQIKRIKDIFDYVPKTTVKNELGTNYTRFSRLVEDPLQFKLIELSKIAKAIGVDTKVLVNMALLHEDDKNKGKKRESNK